MKVVDIDLNNHTMITQAANILTDALPHSWKDVRSAINEIHECIGNDRVIRVATDDYDNVLGWIGSRSMYDGNVWELHPLVVSSEHRGKGIGSALVNDLEVKVREKGAITLWLGTDDETGGTSLSGIDIYPDFLKNIEDIRNLNKHPYEFYLKLGFSIVGVCPDANGFGKPDIYMAKRVRGYETAKKS